MSRIGSIRLCIVLLMVIGSRFKNALTDVAQTRSITRDEATEMIKCFDDKKIKFCKRKPSVNEIKEFIVSSVDNIPRFQKIMLDNMISRIANQESLDQVIKPRMYEIIHYTMGISSLPESEYLYVYCTFKDAIDIVSKIYEMALSTYDELKNFVQKHPTTDLEINNIKAQASLLKKNLFTEIVESYDSAKIIFLPLMSHFVSVLFHHRFEWRDTKFQVINSEIMNIMYVIHSFQKIHP
ncbi:hypothetical protein RF11_14595 [Thelohanellus kitauei]|uniref:Uncharacterized protein n=1 Tax=Thelohanellus kitauei TaxID=669202 RepID=A0A0C2N3D7_THEKT|nr:hypothetical protein RF11_14595 [Thelohanellus kitauei]